ncbi:Uncharacterised protein [Chlamydia trachomatis]|nr:Uncharacterised protein [Chlamydia trachomatis]
MNVVPIVLNVNNGSYCKNCFNGLIIIVVKKLLPVLLLLLFDLMRRKCKMTPMNPMVILIL